MCEIPPIYFWRDRSGTEIDLLVDFGQEQFPIEIKSSKTYNKDFKTSIEKWFNLKDNNLSNGLIIYNGDEHVGLSSNIPAVPWWYL